MAAQSADRPPTFNWTDEEKALLRRTLRVRTLFATELEVETFEGGFLHGYIWLLATIMLTIVGVGWMVFHVTSIDANGLRTPTTLIAMLPVAWILLATGFAAGPAKPGFPVSLFPATPWFIRHRPTQRCLEQLKPTDEEANRIDRVLFATDIDSLLLRTRTGVHESDLIRVRQLIVERCAVGSRDYDTPPERVSRLAGEDILQIPRPFYVLLMRYLAVRSAAADTLVLECSYPSHGHWGLVMLGGILLLAGLPFLVAMGGWPAEIYLGTPASAQIWRLGLVAMPFLVAFAYFAVSARLGRQTCRRTITLSKRYPYLLVKDHLGELHIPIKECLLLTTPDPSAAESDTGSTPKSVFIRHGEKVLARWPLTHPRPSDMEERTLRWGLHEYWRCAAMADGKETRNGEASQPR